MTKDLNLEAVNSALSRENQKLQAELKLADRRAEGLLKALRSANDQMRMGQMNIGWRIVRDALKEGVCD